MVHPSMDEQDLTKRSTRDLLALWAAILRELRRRGLVRTANNPIGDIAEELVARHFKGERAGFSNAGWDVETSDGERLEVKAIRLGEVKTRSNLSPIPPTSTYTSVIIVAFDKDLRLKEALRVPRATVESRFQPRKRDGARVIRLGPGLRSDLSVERLDLSDEVLDL
jgi:hypothetical protein